MQSTELIQCRYNPGWGEGEFNKQEQSFSYIGHQWPWISPFLALSLLSSLRCLTVHPYSFTDSLSYSARTLNIGIPEVNHQSYCLLILKTLPQGFFFLCHSFTYHLELKTSPEALFPGASSYLLLNSPTWVPYNSWYTLFLLFETLFFDLHQPNSFTPSLKLDFFKVVFHEIEVYLITLSKHPIILP